MSDRDRLQQLFDSGALLHPLADVANLVDLTRALAVLAGADGVELTPAAARLRDTIGPAEHHVFVLVDGLGLDQIDRLPAESFLARNTVARLRTVFPSSTAPALTSLATGVWPGEHAVPAWWTYLARQGIQTTILPFVERLTQRPLEKVGIDSATAFPAPVLRGGYGHAFEAFLPVNIAGSVYSRYANGGAPACAYTGLREGVDACLARVSAATAPTFSYLYFPGVDAAEHDYGPHATVVDAAIAVTSHEIERLAAALTGRARIVVSADHGQVFVAEEAKTVLQADDPLLELLLIPPSGEPRAPFFHCKPGALAEFESRFRERLGDRFLLLDIDTVDELRLFGPAPLTEEARSRLGDYVGLGLENNVLLYVPPKRKVNKMVGFHGGLTPAEMQVPLIVL
jgi:hypothetical protein